MLSMNGIPDDPLRLVARLFGTLLGIPIEQYLRQVRNIIVIMRISIDLRTCSPHRRIVLTRIYLESQAT